jgi:cell division protein FtsB
MNYTKEQCDEARSRFLDGQPWEKIVEVFATVPQVTLGEATEMHDRYLSVKNEAFGVCEDFRDAVNAVLAKRGPVITATPTVTLLDPTGGPSMDVPASVVHEMEYPYDVTYTHKRIYDSDADICNLCGSVVVNQAKHTAFHGREVRLMDKPIPEDLKAIWNNANNYSSPWPSETIVSLIERIGRVEQTVESQRKLLDKYDADNTALVQENRNLSTDKEQTTYALSFSETAYSILEKENSALKARAGELNSEVVRRIAGKQRLIEETAKLKAELTMRTAQLDSTLETADREWNDDEDVYKERDKLKAQVENLQGGKYYHDLHCNSSRDIPMGEGGCSCLMYQRARKAEAQVKRLSAPVSDEEILEHMVYGEDGCDVAALIAARLAGKEENHA